MSFEIIMDGSRILWTTSFSWEDNSDVDETTTHSGVITTPADVGNYKIKIDKASINDYVEENEVYGILKKAKTEPITVIAVKKTKRGVNRTTGITCVRTSFSEEVDENGQVSFSIELNAEDIIKEFVKP